MTQAARSTPSPRFTWSHSHLRKADPTVVGNELHLVKSRKGGVLLPADVVERASDPDSAMHELFEWDDSTAAQKHREEQARNIIRSLRIIVEDVEGPTEHRIFVHVTEAGPLKPAGYLTIDEVSRDDARMQLVVQKAERELLAWLRRYKELKAHMPEVFASVEEAVDHLQ